jgi:signal transduction histidine kinase
VRLGLKSLLGLFAGYLLLMLAFALGLQHWLGSLEERLSADTARLIAREQASLVVERSLELLHYRDADARRRLRERIQDLTLVSEVVSSVAVVDRDGQVLESDAPGPHARLPAAAEVFGDAPGPRVVRSARRFLSGGDYVALLPLLEGPEPAGYLRIVLHSDRISGLYQHGRASLMRLALLGLAGVCALGVFLQVQLSRRAATITALLEGTPPPRGRLAQTDEFARALRAASQVKGALADARRQSERRSHQVGALAELLKVGVVLVSRDFEVDYASDRARELVGSADEASFRQAWEALRPALRDAAGQLRPEAGSRLAVVKAGGGVEAELHPLGAEDREDYVVLLRSSGALQALEADALLASQLEGLGRVYRTMAHELRAPLSAMLINLDLLRESLTERGSPAGEPAAAQRRYVEVLREELNRLNRSLHGILTQTLPDAKPTTFDVAQSLADLASLLAPQARRQGIELRTRLDEGPLPVRGYPDRLRQAFLNVAVNALEAMPRGGSLVLQARHEDGGTLVSLSDTGPGIPPQALEHIYEPDFSTKEGGSGVGLYVARALVELHGGTIQVQSEPGRGTEVKVTLPPAPGED